MKGNKVETSAPEAHGQRDADGKGDAQHRRRGDAHQLGGFAIVGDGADSFAGTGAIEEQFQRQRDHHGRDGRGHVVSGEGVGADGDAGQREVDVVGAGAPDRGADADDHHVHGEGREQAHQHRSGRPPSAPTSSK